MLVWYQKSLNSRENNRITLSRKKILVSFYFYHNNQICISNSIFNVIASRKHCITGSKKLDGTRFKKASLKTTDVKVSDFKSEISKRVGMIRHQENAIGTGFRVGKNKVMTCWHVICPYITGNKRKKERERKKNSMCVTTDLFSYFQKTQHADANLTLNDLIFSTYYFNSKIAMKNAIQKTILDSFHIYTLMTRS